MGFLKVIAGLLLLLLLSGFVNAIGPEHVFAATILKADIAGKTFVAKTLDGAEHTYHFSPQAPISSLAEAAISKSLYGGEGYQFLIRYTIERKEQIVTGFDYVGREAWKTAEGNLLKADPVSGTIVIKNADGNEMSFQAGKHFVVETATGAKAFAEWLNGKEAPAITVILRYTEPPAGKLVHLIEIPSK